MSYLPSKAEQHEMRYQDQKKTNRDLQLQVDQLEMTVSLILKHLNMDLERQPRLITKEPSDVSTQY